MQPSHWFEQDWTLTLSGDVTEPKVPVRVLGRDPPGRGGSPCASPTCSRHPKHLTLPGGFPENRRKTHSPEALASAREPGNKSARGHLHKSRISSVSVQQRHWWQTRLFFIFLESTGTHTINSDDLKKRRFESENRTLHLLTLMRLTFFGLSDGRKGRPEWFLLVA